jgi:cyclophilin family peptidyl-prolyl cis-trans isomerase
VKVTLETSKGTLELELDADKAPISVQNFVNYAEKGSYDGTIFHRVIPGFMIQGGGFTPDMQQKPTDKPIQCESKNGLKNVKGAIAMARTSDPHSATSQFFINVKDNTNLDFPSFDGWGYAVFGKVTKGMEVCDAIVGVATAQKGPHGDVPVEPITITKVTVTK